jgi:Domain of unknown function (DUF1844)
MASGESKAGGFTVNDRRSFTADREAGAEAENAGDRAATEPAPPAKSGAPSSATTLPAVDFHTFVLSLGSSALLHLGELEHPDVGAAQKDLPLAKHTIDILAMLQEKTKGNLTSAEDKLIESLLFDLRLRYVDASKAPGK